MTGGAFSHAVLIQTEPVSVEAYWQTLEDIRSELEAGPAASEFADRAADLESVTAVKLPDGTLLPVDNRYLAGLLRTEPLETERLTALLDRALAAREAGGTVRSAEGELNALAAILAGPDYRWPDPAPPNPLVELWQRFLNGLARLLGRLAPGAGIGSIINTVLLIGIALVLALILRYIYIYSVRSVIREAEIDPAAGIPPGLTATSAFEQARNHAEAGDRREAVRYLYLAALLVLEERGHIRLDRAHTNRELLADLSPRPALAGRFREVIETFDRVWYGFQPITREEFARYTDSVTELGK
jgi:hypothetical protein